MTAHQSLYFALCLLGSAGMLGCVEAGPAQHPGQDTTGNSTSSDPAGTAGPGPASTRSHQPPHKAAPTFIISSSARANSGGARPEAVESIAALLLARHVKDLPNRDTLSKTRGARQAVEWIAENDPYLVVRARAVEALALWPDEQNRRYLLATARNAALPAMLRASAWRALAAWDPAVDAELKAEAAAASTDQSVPVAYAARELLAQ